MNTTNKFQFTNNGLRNNFEAENLHIQSHSEIIYSISEKVSGEWCDRKINLLAHNSPKNTFFQSLLQLIKKNICKLNQ